MLLFFKYFFDKFLKQAYDTSMIFFGKYGSWYEYHEN